METIVASEPVVNLTANAAQEVKTLLAKAENTGKTLRVYVEKGGCSGMQYSMVFDEARPDDLATEMHGVSRSSRSEEHTSELQSLRHLVCRPLLATNTT